MWGGDARPGHGFARRTRHRLAGDPGNARASAEADLRAGPPALAPGAVETKRYGLTDALDDLADASDRIECLAVGGLVLQAADASRSAGSSSRPPPTC
ncbi:hypothetical protein [Streptomyces sp. NPDC058583]|uniref:hypothetical protein n=1 Tax=unclassified Streptomyces TaxID=2593676 RepID=UPI00364DAE24